NRPPRSNRRGTRSQAGGSGDGWFAGVTVRPALTLTLDRTYVLSEGAMAGERGEGRTPWPCTWCGAAVGAYRVRYYDRGWIEALICEACAQRDGIDPLLIA